jgi:uncharacterized membrane protein
MTDFKRITRHLLSSHRQVRRVFTPATLTAIEQAIGASEASHGGEIRFVVEAGLDGASLFQGQTARERAIELFAQLGVWDTAHRSGLLLYVLLADRAVEIVADRGIDARVGSAAWQAICRGMEVSFRQGRFASGASEGVQALTRLLVEHFPAPAGTGAMGRLPDRPLLI